MESSKVKWNFMIFAIAYLCSGSVSGEIYFKDGSPHTILSQKAAVSGITKYSRDGRPYLQFSGIPYASIPERFAASDLITEPTWEGIRNGSIDGPMCPQMNIFGNIMPVGEEDCLHLTVHVPMTSKIQEKPLPVMVYIHSGGFGMGSHDEVGGTYYTDEEVILVNLNYRVNVFGFLSTGDEVVPGNNGLKDQVNALKWVQKNIHKFGGDSNAVTIFGVSGGGGSVHYLYLSEMTKGLFHRAIVQSGTALASWAFEERPKEKAVKLANYFNCETSADNPSQISSQEILTCLRKVPKEQLTKAATDFIPGFIPWEAGGLFNFVPVAEPKSSPSPFLTESPITLVENPQFSPQQVPLMIGMAAEEGASLCGGVALKGLGNDLNTKWKEVAPQAFLLDKFLSPEDQLTVVDKIRDFYFQDKPISRETRQGMYDAYSDAWGLFGARKAAKAVVASQAANQPVYLYLFSYISRTPSIMSETFNLDPNDKLAYHGADLEFMTDMNEMLKAFGLSTKTDSEDEKFSRNFVRLWCSFAKHGKPGHFWGNSKDKVWTPVSAEEAEGKKTLKWYKIDENPGLIEEPFSERMKFWEGLWNNYILKTAYEWAGNP